jgi:transposase
MEYKLLPAYMLFSIMSNGPVEGHITRLKLLKRQSYGRAGVGLLRQRMMQTV